jgi:hypothetical protein
MYEANHDLYTCQMLLEYKNINGLYSVVWA